MRRIKVLLFMAVVLICQAGAQPMSPYVTMVSYDENDNNFYITWNDTNSNPVLKPDTFIIYINSGSHTNGGAPIYDVFDKIKATNPGTYKYLIPQQSPVNFKTYYLFDSVYFFAVEASRSTIGKSTNNLTREPYIDAPSNVLLNNIEFDTCNYTLTLRWNKFYGWPAGENERYQLYYSKGGGSPILYQPNGRKTLIDTFIKIQVRGDTFLLNSTYSFQVYDVNMTTSATCHSNIRTINTNVPVKPSFINADGTEILTDNGHIVLSFTKDGGSQMHYYKLLRSDNYDGPYNIVDTIDRSGITFLDTDAVNATSKILFYKVEALNNCNIKVNESNIESTIILKGRQSGNAINLGWNSYNVFAGITGDYIVYRSSAGESYSALTTTTDTFATDRLDTVAEKTASLTIRYYVIARETNNPNGISGLVKSNTLDILIQQKIAMPDFFTPNGDNKNDKYKVPIAFLAKEFKFIVYDRWGTKVFETSDSGSEGWDGKINGSTAPQGAYIYYLKIVGSDNSKVEQKGSFLLILP